MTDFYADWVRVVPAPADRPATARELIAAARDLGHEPGIVRSVAGGSEFLVPPDVAAAHAGERPAPKKRRAAPRKQAATVNPFADDTEGSDHAD